MKYIKQFDSSFTAVDEASELYAALQALPEGRRPSFVDASSPEVAVYRASLNKLKRVSGRTFSDELVTSGHYALCERLVSKDMRLKIWFERTAIINRDDPSLATLIAGGLPVSVVDDIFTYKDQLL
jgi:hypothetical protein